jgi:hypothetical protein
MLRAGVSVPALMKLLGHRTANMTLRYVEITQKDLQREFYLARQSIRHLIPLPASAAVADPDAADATAVVERLSAAIRVLELYRQQISSHDKPLQLLLRRLVRVRSRFSKSRVGHQKRKIGSDWPDLSLLLFESFLIFSHLPDGPGSVTSQVMRWWAAIEVQE